MKNIYHSFILSLCLSLWISFTIGQDIPSCCQLSSSSQFALLGKNESFRASHLNPLPFEYVPTKGTMISIASDDGKKAKIFEIKADKPTNNYLFVFQEWWGLNDYVKQEAERLQEELGVNVLALDLYDGKVASNKEDAAKYMGEVKEKRIRSIIQAAIAYAGRNARIQTIGWCFGGGWSLQASIMAGKQGNGCVIYYGMPEKDVSKLKSLHAPVLGIFATKDDWITPEVVNEFLTNMKKNGKDVKVQSYSAHHAFANPSNPKYDKAIADDANKLAAGFLKEHRK